MGKLILLAAGVLLGLLLAKLWRGRSGGDLTDAPRFQRPPPKFVGGDAMSDPEIIALIRQNRKIEAIKRMRERTGLGLAEAKDAVEAMERNVD